MYFKVQKNSTFLKKIFSSISISFGFANLAFIACIASAETIRPYFDGSPLYPLSTGSLLLSTNCIGSGNHSTCTAVGYHSKEFGYLHPLLYQSIDGSSWKQIVTGITDYGVFFSTSCSGDTCTAVGYGDVGMNIDYPLLYQSTNGSSWSAVTTEERGSFLSTSCTGTGRHVTCTAAGVDHTTGLGLLYQRKNGGSWNAVPIDIKNRSVFYSTSCTGTGSNATCTAAGADEITKKPLLYQSINGGPWSDIMASEDQGVFYSTSCTGTGRNATCTAVGFNRSADLPGIYQSINGGDWVAVEKEITNHSSFSFYSTSCTGKNSHTTCMAVGKDFTTQSPIAYQSIDGGPWNAVITPEYGGQFNSTSCTGSGKKVTCTVVDSEFSLNKTDTPILYQKTNDELWSALTTKDNSDSFFSTNCTGHGNSAICTAVGINFKTGFPLIYQKTNGGYWHAVNLG